MELNKKCMDQDSNQKLSLPTSSLEPEMHKESWMDSNQAKDFLEDFPHLDDLPIAGSSSAADDFFDPLFNRSSTIGFKFLEYKPFEESDNNIGGLSIYNGMEAPVVDANLPDHNLIPSSHQQVNPVDISIQGESSRIAADSGKFSNNAPPSSTRNPERVQNIAKSAKEQWTPEEDRALIQHVENFGVGKWSQISKILQGRKGKQCRDRWHNHLMSDIKKDTWTEEEDKILVEVHAEIGSKWVEIAKRLPGRTENSIKNHWHAATRRLFSGRKCRKKWPTPSILLQNYIKSLHTEKDSNGSRNASTSNAPSIARQGESSVPDQDPMELSNV
ncbi:transcription factor MYB115-like [Coffea arabica]|uniref:Transcription factor MYB115-like n=1 Tax=Coffea arabica TaxID=13443 RepID=A0ABM4U0X0_COFAR